jgi:hypothetical protein
MYAFYRMPDSTAWGTLVLTAARATVAPSALGIEPVAHRCAGQLANEGREHVSRVDPVSGLGLDRVDGRPVRDVCKLVAHIDRYGLDDGSSDGEVAGKGPCRHAGQFHNQAKQCRDQRGKLVDDQQAVDRAQADDRDADQAEEANVDGAVAVRRAGEQEGERGPVAREDSAAGEADETSLDQERLGQQHVGYAPEHGEVVEPARVLGRVVRQEGEEQREYGPLDAQANPVDVAPAGEVGDDTGQHAGDEHAEHQPGDNNRKCRGTSLCRRKIADQGQHELGRDGGDPTEEGDGGENIEGLRETQHNPLDGRRGQSQKQPLPGKRMITDAYQHSRESHETQDQVPSLEDVTQRADEQ